MRLTRPGAKNLRGTGVSSPLRGRGGARHGALKTSGYSCDREPGQEPVGGLAGDSRERRSACEPECRAQVVVARHAVVVIALGQSRRLAPAPDVEKPRCRGFSVAGL